MTLRRHIQLPALRHWDPLRLRLDQGEDFAALAESYSDNKLSRPGGGLLPPFSRDDPSMPEMFRTVAFSLKPGQVSNPFEYEGAFHVFKLERRIPPDPTPFEEARPALHDALMKRRVQEEMEKLSASLWRDCSLRINDPILREQYTKLQAAGQVEGPVLVGE